MPSSAKVAIDFQVLTATVLSGLLIAGVVGGIAGYVRLGVLTASVDTLKTEIMLLRKAAHAHPVSRVPTYLPDAEPED